MGFADHYLGKHCVFQPFIKEKPASDLFLIVVIPCYNEPELISSLKSLAKNEKPRGKVEVIVVINQSENAVQDIRTQNQISLHEGREWCKNNDSEWISYHFIETPDLESRHAGVGFARKIGMDEAVHRFNLIQCSDGIIAGFDADATCTQNYITAIELAFANRSKTRACSIYFEHPVSGNAFSSETYNSICSYELFLRYFIHAQRWAGFPQAFQTIGSSFAVRALSYCQAGGMNRRQAGEDFWFLHKIIPLGGYFELTEASIYPSPRVSDRVPFGTGAAIAKLLNSGDSHHKTYHFDSFRLLKFFFNSLPEFYESNYLELNKIISRFPSPLSEYLNSTFFAKQLAEIKANSAGFSGFSKRFFMYFDAFWIIKFLNNMHINCFTLINSDEAALAYFHETGQKYQGNSSRELLETFRKIDRNFPYSV